MSTGGKRLVDIMVSILNETEKAYKVDTGYKTVWIAKSLAKGVTDKGDGTFTMKIPFWLADKEDIEHDDFGEVRDLKDELDEDEVPF